jgi:hypothetical protein
MTGEGDGIFIGVTFKNAPKVFKPNTVYELREIMGEIDLKEVGPANVNWAYRIGDILDGCCGDWMLSKEEQAKAKAKEED